ncbi:P-type conjugative transfer protein VirB9 [Serratia marcescens]|nr:P-type conjugative transfer protein VirB9 [Serratia marcescens]
MKFTVALLALSLVAGGVQAAATPQGSRYDSRMQQVSYNPYNTTVINTQVAFLSTLVFDDDETVIDARSGMAKGWDVQHDANRVYVMPVPVTQTEEVTDSEGQKTRTERVYEPVPQDWTTNLFVVTSKRYYSLELKVTEPGKTPVQPAFVVSYTYPQENRAKAEKMAAARQQEMQQAKEREAIARALENAQYPRNWEYYARPGKDKANSSMIMPDVVYDDGRFTYVGFKPGKKFPAAFSYIDGREQILNTSVKQKADIKYLVIQQVNPAFVLRYGNAVIGIVNKGFGKVQVKDGNTVSPQVERVEKE